MRLVVKKNDREISDYKFTKGPIHIGRHADSHIFLSDRAVSRHHAVIFETEDGKWVLEDLDSANKTYLDDKEVHRTEIGDNSIIRIADFIIEISMEDVSEGEKDIDLEDTLEKTAYDFDDTSFGRQPQVITRRTDFKHAPEMRFPARRARDFIKATEGICKADSEDEIIATLLEIANSQFDAYHSWCALRAAPAGAMTSHSGRCRDGSRVQFNQIKLNEKITEAIEKKQFLLIPRAPVEMREELGINSVMIGPIISKDSCYGVLYVDNDMSHDHYSLSDLDYMMLLSIHTAAILRNF